MPSPALSMSVLTVFQEDRELPLWKRVEVLLHLDSFLYSVVTCV